MTVTQSRWALVTGASSGLGAALATALAERHINLVLVARREVPMLDLAAQLMRRHGITVMVEAMDLSHPGSAAALEKRLDTLEINPDILINNAAFGLSSPFTDHEPERLKAMLQLNIVSLTELTHIYGKRMALRGGGHVLLVASLAAYQPTPLLAAYGAAKAYVLALGEALNVEFSSKVGVTVLSPGLMDTGFNKASGYQVKPSMRGTMLPPARVAEIGLNAMFAGKSGVIAGRLNGIMAFANRFMSRHLQAQMVFRMSKGQEQ